MIKWVAFGALALAGVSPACAASFDLDYQLSVTSRQQSIDGVLQPIVGLPTAEQRSYSGTLRVDFGAVTESLEDGPSANQKVRVQTVAVTYDFFALAPDLLPYSPAAGLPPPTTRLESSMRLARTETNGAPDEGGAYRLRDLAWSSEVFSSAFDIPTSTSRIANRAERIFSFLQDPAFRFGSLTPEALARALEADQYRTCGNFTCAFNGALAWTVFNGDHTLALQPYSYTGTADLFLGTMTFSNARAAVPESASWVLMIAGFGFVGFASRARSRQLSV